MTLALRLGSSLKNYSACGGWSYGVRELAPALPCGSLLPQQHRVPVGVSSGWAKAAASRRTPKSPRNYAMDFCYTTLALGGVNWRYVGIPEGRGFSPAVSAPHPADGKHCFPGTPLPQKGEGLGVRGWRAAAGLKPRPSRDGTVAGSASIRLAAPSRENWPLVLVQLRL